MTRAILYLLAAFTAGYFGAALLDHHAPRLLRFAPPPNLDGEWTVTSMALDGVDYSPRYIDGVSILAGAATIDYTIFLFSRQVKGSFTFDGGSADFTITSGFRQGKTMLAIWKLDGDTLVICGMQSDQGGRPTEFSAEKGSGQGLVTLKKDQEEKKQGN